MSFINCRHLHADKEKCPFLRLIWQEGYHKVVETRQGFSGRIELMAPNGYVKVFTPFEFYSFIYNLTIKGDSYKWVADGDGSSNKFREFIKREENKS